MHKSGETRNYWVMPREQRMSHQQRCSRLYPLLHPSSSRSRGNPIEPHLINSMRRSTDDIRVTGTNQLLHGCFLVVSFAIRSAGSRRCGDGRETPYSWRAVNESTTGSVALSSIFLGSGRRHSTIRRSHKIMMRKRSHGYNVLPGVYCQSRAT